MEQITVMVAAERTLFRQGLVALIGANDCFRVVAEAADADEARRANEREHPEIIILDSELPQAERACDLVPCLLAGSPKTAVVVLGEADRLAGSEAEADSALRAERALALQQGAAAYLPARADGGELQRLLAMVAATLQCADTDAETDPTENAAVRPVSGAGRHKITERERAIIAMIAQGLCNKEVAHRLGISTQTVKNHVSRLLEKLSLADRTQLAVYAAGRQFEF
jgi:DNA-binding NarL/FixJ family response regulator